jgi:hypothetical protein
LALILAYSSLEFGNSSRDLVTGKNITPDHVNASIGAFVASVIAGFAAVSMED